MWETAGKIIEYGIIGVLVVTSVGILENTTSHFIGTLKTIHDDNLKDHRKVIEGQERIEKITKDNNKLFGSVSSEKHPH